MKSLVRSAFTFLLTCVAASGALYTLDDPASPISVSFNDSGGKFTVTDKTSGWAWRNPDTLVSGTNPTFVTGATVLADGHTLNANITISGNTYSVVAELRTSPSELRVTLGNATATMSGINYPHPFYASDGQGFAVLPFDSGYVVPNTITTFTLPGGQRAMEWYGGTDSNNTRGWVALIDTPDDYEMKVRNGTVSGANYLGAVVNWRGSNDNATHTPNKVCYDRTVRFRFSDGGGYVALAKIFRSEATTRGYVKTFAQKQADAPNLDLSKFLGSPICYLWGDGRSTALLDAMQSAGIDKAHIQVSINHTDQAKNFPATNLADNAWFDAVRARGYTGGFYDIYAGMRSSGQGGSPYDGFYYLWPGTAYTEWTYINSSNQPVASGNQASICNTKAAEFATSTRLPQHISRFNLDACFFDVVCAVDLTEDYDATYGHFATRAIDRAGRFNLLNAAYANPTKKLLTATEQGRSWAVPALHWVEGKFWVGEQGAGLSDGAWDDPNVYPSITSDVIDPQATGKLKGLFGDGYSAPLWDLVYHDCVVNTTHWHRPHNKYLYGWDHQDRWALLRGQAPLLHLTYDGTQGLASRKPNTLADNTGVLQSTRWTVSHDHFVQTYNTVCQWHGEIGAMEMINHARLTTDRSVQMSEFSSDGGLSGRGIVVNFGTYDDTNGYGGSAWNGTLRGTALSVPVRSYATYSWNNTGANNAPVISFLPAQQTTIGTALGPLAFTVSDAETASGSLTVTASSSNPMLLPVANIVFGGSGASRTVTLTPAAGQPGSATITLTVSDGALTRQTSFVLNAYASINTPPTVTGIANQSASTGGSVGPLAFTIGDAQTAAESLTVTATSSSQSVLPNANIVVGGSGASRTVTLTAGSTAGSSDVTLTVSDGSIFTQKLFTLTTTSSGNTAPTITTIANQTTAVGVAVGPLSFTVGDAETAAAALTTTGSSSNTTALPNANITFGGSGASRTVTLTPASGQSGTSTVTLTVSDGSLSAQTSFTLTASSGPQTITSLAALHQNGQTFLTWDEVGDSSATYRIYRSASAFTSTAQFNATNLIGTASADSSFDTRLSALRSTTYYYRITAAGPDLTGSQGVFVFTPVADGAPYYAVTAVVGGVEQLALSTGQNTTSAVNETVAMPEPIFQRSVTVSSRTVEVYVHWAGATATASYPAMGNQNSVPHHFGLVRRGAAALHSLVVRPHARQGSFLSTVTGTNSADEWVLTLDDWMQNSIENTFWYGYHETFDLAAGGPQATSGTVQDYTTRRAKWEIEWALRTLPLDLNRIYLTGHSMGGIGSTFLGILLRDRIAAIWTTSAKYDFSFLTDPNSANIWNSGSNERATTGDVMWGTVAANLLCSEGIPVYDRLNAGYLAQAFKAENLPVFISFNGKNDVVVGWAEKIGFYQTLATSRQGGMFFWDSGVHNRTGGEFVPEQDINVLNRYQLDQSYPAFTNSSANGNPGNGTATNGDAYGTINGNLDWDTGSIVDTASQWQIRLLTVALSNTAPVNGLLDAPATATADITPRRLQAFPHTPGKAARYEVRDASDTLLKQGLVVADADGLFTIPAVPLNPSGTTLTLNAAQQTAPACTNTTGGVALTWPTTVGVNYQVEWSPDLNQWFPMGAPALATTSSMAWTDNGSQTGSSPDTEPKRFYRLRLSE